jgi:hypothetical protein
MVWSARVLGLWLALGTALAACGSGDGHKQARYCSEECPTERCEEATGVCLPPEMEPSGGQPNEPDPPSAGAPAQVADDTAPVVELTSPEQGAVLGTQVTFEFEADEPSTFTCTLNDEPVDDCEPGITLSDLASGENTFTVMATDAAGNDSEIVAVTFIVNVGPTLDAWDEIVTPEDTSTGELTFTVGDADTELEQLVVTAALDSDSPIRGSGLILSGSGAERTVMLTPALDEFGPAVLTLSVSDGVVTTTKDIPVTVTPVNDAPVIEDVPDKRVEEHGVLGPVTFHVGDIETPTDDLVVAATSSDTAKLPDENIVLGRSGVAHTFTITPLAQRTGTVEITLTVSDGELTASDTFVLTLGSTDDEPTISAIAKQTTKEDTAKTVSFKVGDPDTALSALVPSASFDPNGIVKSVTFSGSGADRKFKITPKPNQTGTANVSITISDATGGVSSSFVLTVTPVNDAPTVTPPANQTIAEEGSTGALAFSVADVDSSTLTVSAASSDTVLIPNANITVAPISGSPGSRNVTVKPVANGHGGPVTITLTVSDGSLTGTGTFTVTVSSVNDPPTISNITNRTVEPDTATGNIAFTVADPDGDTPLTVTASSDDLRVVPAANITLGGTGGNRTIALTPGANQGGSSVITVTVSDGHGGTASDTFTLSAKVKLTGAVVGAGTVVASGTGCPANSAVCAALPGNGAVTFVATPNPGAMFVNWTGACSGSGDGVVTPIPTAGVTCTANFRNLWARLFYTPNDLQVQRDVGARGVVETTSALRYVGSVGDDGSTALVWNANKLTGAVIANTAFELTQDGSLLTPVDIVTDGANGTVIAVNGQARNGTGLIWLGASNQIVRAHSYEADDNVTSRSPNGMIRNRKGGLTFVQGASSFSPDVQLLPGELVRVGATGAVVGGTSYTEALGDCAAPRLAASYTPVAVAQNSAGSYLVAGIVLDGGEDFTYRMNLTLFDEDGVPLWARHVEPADTSLFLFPEGVVASGEDFFVTGLMEDIKESYDAFGMSISGAGDIKWWKSLGDDGVQETGVKATLSGSDLVLAGGSTQEGTSDFFALTWKADGSLASGYLYGGVGAEQGLVVAPANGGGYNLFGSSIDSFGNAANSTWALRVDRELHLVLDTGSVVPYEPNLRDQSTDNVQIACANDGMYRAITPVIHDLNVNRSARTIGGAYQAGP